jgi:hypothetical protein
LSGPYLNLAVTHLVGTGSDPAVDESEVYIKHYYPPPTELRASLRSSHLTSNVSVEETWKSRRVLWLPSEYRDSGWKCREDTIVLRYALEESVFFGYRFANLFNLN